MALAGVAAQVVALLQQLFALRSLGFGPALDNFYLGDAPAEFLRVVLSMTIGVVAMPALCRRVASAEAALLERAAWLGAGCLGALGLVLATAAGWGGGWTMLLTAPTIWVTARLVTATARFQAERRFGWGSGASVASSLVGLMLVVLLLPVLHGLALPVAFLAAQPVAPGILALSARVLPPLKPASADGLRLRDALCLVGPVAGASAVSRFNVLCDRMIAAALLPAGAVSILALASKVAMVPQVLVGTPVATAAYPRLVRTAETGNRRLALRIAGYAGLGGLVVGGAVLAAAFDIAAPVLSLSVHERSTFVATLAAFGGISLLAGTGSVLSRAHYALGRGRFLLLWTLGEAIANLVLDLGLGTLLGAPGIALATTVTVVAGVFLLSSRLPGRRPRRLVVLANLRAGGGQRICLSRVRSARARGERVVLVTLNASYGPKLAAEQFGSRAWSLAPLRSLRLQHAALIALAWFMGADVVEGHLSPADDLVAACSGRVPGRTEVMLHGFTMGPEGREQAPEQYGAYLARMRRADRIVAISNALARFASSVAPDSKGPPVEVELPHLDLQPEISRAEARALLGLEEDDYVVVSVSRIEPRKGVAELIEAFAQSATERGSARLLLVGAPNPGGEDYVRQLKRRIVELHLADRVSLVGHVDDTSPYYAAADAFALASLSEGYCLAAAEAGAHGLPTVVTNVGGLPEAASEDALLVPATWSPELDSVPVNELAAALVSIFVRRSALYA